MESLFSTFTHITWWVIGIVIIVLEVFVGGTLLLWFGIAAIVVGLLLFFGVPLGWEMQLVIFAVFSIFSVIIWRMVLKQYAKEHPDEPNSHLSRRGESYKGRLLIVKQEIKNGVGKVAVEDTLWRARGPDTPVGQRVKVVGVKGASLIVEKED